MDDIKKDFFRILAFAFIVVLFGIGSFIALTTGKGLESEAFIRSFTLYMIMLGLALFGYVIIGFWNYLTHKRNVYLLLHDPEDSLTNFLPFKNPVLLGLLCVVFFLPLMFYLGKYGNIFLASIPTQQISTFSNVWADAVFPSLAENLLFTLVISVALTLILKISRKGVAYYFLSIIVLPLVLGFGWLLFHNAVYGSNELALSKVYLFGLFGVFLTVATGSIVVWLILHFFNNFMLASRTYGLFSSDVFTVSLISVWILSIIGFVYYYKFLLSHKKRSR